MNSYVRKASRSCATFSTCSIYTVLWLKQDKHYNENNVPPAQLQKTPLNRKGILAAVPIC